jgi:predicted Zn finger-like uncharacterized protein
MPEVVTCPQCERQLRVPDELVGQRVKCPTCGTNFTANLGPPTRPPEGEERPRPSSQVEDYRGEDRPSRRPRREADGAHDVDEEVYDDDDAPRRSSRKQKALNSVKAPAICLLITAILGIGLNAFQVVYAGVRQPAPAPQVAANAKPTPMDEFMIEFQKNQTGPVPMIFGAVFVLVNVIIALGAISMLRGRSYGLGMAATILSMINIGNCCCVLGLPFGVWSLIVLLKEDVKRAFQ